MGSTVNIPSGDTVEVNLDQTNDEVLCYGYDGGTNRALHTDSSGDLQVDILSGAGGTQYTEGDTDASITGTAAMMEGAANTLLPVQGTVADGLLVNLGANNDVTVTGTVAVSATDLDIRNLTQASDSVAIGDGTDTVDILSDGADNLANTANQLVTAALLYAYDGTTWDRVTNGGGVEATALRVTIASDSTGVLSVDDNGSSLTVDNAGTFATQVDGDALTALQLIDDTVYTDDTSTHATGTSKGLLFMAAATPTDAAVTANDIGAVAMTTDRKLHVAVMDALPAGTNGIGKLTSNAGVTIGAVEIAAAQTLATVTTVTTLTGTTTLTPGTGASNLGKAEDGGHTTGDVGVFALAVRNDTPNTAITGSDADYSQISTYKTGAVRTAIPEEDFAVLGSNHVKKYYTNAGAVTDGIVWSPAAGKRWYVTDMIVNTSAAATVTFEDDLGAGDAAVMKMELAANGGFSHKFGTPLFSGEDAADLLVTTSAGNIYITITGYEI